MNGAIRLKLVKTEKSESAKSHLFGSPIVPESLYDEVSELDVDVMFFGQIALSELSKFNTGTHFDENGTLYLFLDTAAYPYKAVVFYSEDEPRYVIDDFNSEVDGFERFTEPFAVEFEECIADSDGTKLFGTPSWECELDGELFMQFDPLDGDTGFLSEIDGYAFFVFSDEERKFENIRFIIERS